MARDASSSRPGGLSLYANLLDSSSSKDSSPGTISRAPVVFKQSAGEDVQPDRASIEKQQQISAATLRFQPTKRPQTAAQKLKSKPTQQKPSVPVPPPYQSPPELPNSTARPLTKTTLADWTGEADENDVNGFYGGEKRQRGGRKKRKRNKEESHVVHNWDDIYDPSRPNNYEDYKHSDERILEVRGWKEKLYAHRLERRRHSDSSSSIDQDEQRLNKKFGPIGMSFAPPTEFNDSVQLQDKSQMVDMPSHPTGEDALARPMSLAGSGDKNGALEPPFSAQQLDRAPHPPPPPPPQADLSLDSMKPSPLAANISRAPVRYNLPEAPSELPASEAELESALQFDEAKEDMPPDTVTRSLRPGQKGFAERLMSKYGWSKGSGLGASGSGIINPLHVRIEKQKKKPDSEGGGFVGPGGRGTIVGGKKGASGPEIVEGKFGTMSEVVVLRGMVDGMDLEAEMEDSSQGGLMQEIGQECGEKYGRVERVFIERGEQSEALVFVKFTSQLSALRAVNALEGRIFNGNTIQARFFDVEKFELGIYA